MNVAIINKMICIGNFILDNPRAYEKKSVKKQSTVVK